MKEWLPISEAASKLGISDRALYYRIKKGKVESRTENGNRFVLMDIDPSKNASEGVSETTSEVTQKLFEEKDARIRLLEDQLEKITSLLALSEKNVSALSDQNHLLLEDTRQQPSFWQRFIKAYFAEA